MSTLLRVVTVADAVGAACVGGVFFAFSGFVMPALGRLSTRDAVTTMQSINVTAVRPPLMIALFGTAVCCVVVCVEALRADIDDSRRILLLSGVVLYLVGSVGLTIAYNEPLNDELAIADPSAADTIAQWQHYLTGWTRANTVRAAASLAAAGCFVTALLRS